jgi:ABC-type multidrug transport system fused ATPase/permease subunit
MPPETANMSAPERPMLATLRRFLPYLWPAGETGLKARIIGAMLFVALSKIVQVYGVAYSLKYAVDRMSAGQRDPIWIVAALVIGYAGARFGTTAFDNIRNVIFERVGQEATRRLAASVFRHLHNLSLRFHLERRRSPGSISARPRSSPAGLTISMVMAVRASSGRHHTVGDFVLINAMLIQLYQPLNFMGMVYREIKQAIIDIEQMFSLIEPIRK